MISDSLIPNLDKISSFDFNLLFIFETIFTYNSVSIAAKKLGSSPSSVSQSLNRLRIYFSDPLFIRKGQGLIPTTVAINLHERVRVELGALVKSLFTVAESEMNHNFMIYSSPYTAQRILPKIGSVLFEKNLPYELTHIPANAALDAGEDILTYRKADLVFDTKPYYSNSTVTTLYMEENIIAVCRKSHPRLGTFLSKENMVHEKFIRFNINTPGVQKTQVDIEESLPGRIFNFTSSSIDVNAAVAEITDSVTFISEWFFNKFGESYNLKKLDTGFELKPIKYFMTDNKSATNNAHFAKFIDVVKKTIRDDLVTNHLSLPVS
ncbi:LysR family transcriptional regulator [Rahnella sp. PCH160]|uniref:LysR family transcriptional regulator n=1 Tax=Rahnella sp. PCH160 TaxID=3447928 RepID=UPI0039FDD5B4